MQQIINHLNSAGLIVSHIIPDGKIHRCNSASKNKKNKNGWYVLKEHNSKYYCYYGCWVSGLKGKYSDALNGSADHHVWQLLDRQQKEAEEKKRIKGIKKATEFLEKCNPAQDHPYLKKKQIKPHNILQFKNKLVIPLYNKDGQVSTYQTISPDGEKWFMPDGVVGGCCFPIQGNNEVVCVCEGFATGATIHEATGYKVLCAMNAGNLAKIADQVLGNVLICADNDHKTKGNPGITAAKKTGYRYVYPSGIKGTDFNDMAVEKDIETVRQEIIRLETIEVMTADDFKGCNDTLKIPDDAIPAGLIEQGINALEGDIIQYDLPLVLTVISRAIAGKISLNGVHPNVFNLKIGGTSTGKTASDKRFLQCLNIDGFVSLNDIASGPGLLRAISKNPQGMGFFDEVTSLFQRSNKGGIDTVAEGKAFALLDVFSRSGQSFTKSYGDSKNTINIENPCFSLLGNATPAIFEAIQLKDFESGLMQRFDFWVYDGPIKPKSLYSDEYFKKTCAFIDALNQIMLAQCKKKRGLSGLINPCIELKRTEKAEIYIKEYSEYVVNEANKYKETPGKVGFMSRRFDLALKYALIHHAACRKADKLFSNIDDKDIQYGIMMAELLGGWKSNVLGNKVVSGDFHKDCEIFKTAIKMAVKADRTPTFKYLASRKIQLKNWEEKHSQAIINILLKRGEIITKEGQRSTQYYLTKGK